MHIHSMWVTKKSQNTDTISIINWASEMEFEEPADLVGSVEELVFRLEAVHYQSMHKHLMKCGLGNWTVGEEEKIRSSLQICMRDTRQPIIFAVINLLPPDSKHQVRFPFHIWNRFSFLVYCQKWNLNLRPKICDLLASHQYHIVQGSNNANDPQFSDLRGIVFFWFMLAYFRSDLLNCLPRKMLTWT